MSNKFYQQETYFCGLLMCLLLINSNILQMHVSAQILFKHFNSFASKFLENDFFFVNVLHMNKILSQ